MKINSESKQLLLILQNFTPAIINRVLFKVVLTDDPQNRLMYATVVPAVDFDVSAARDELYYFGSTSAGKSVQT